MPSLDAPVRHVICLPVVRAYPPLSALPWRVVGACRSKAGKVPDQTSGLDELYHRVSVYACPGERRLYYGGNAAAKGNTNGCERLDIYIRALCSACQLGRRCGAQPPRGTAAPLSLGHARPSSWSSSTTVRHLTTQLHRSRTTLQTSWCAPAISS